MSYLDTYQNFLESPELTEEEKARLLELTEEEKKEMFAIPLAFGTAGMRGVLDQGTNRMNRFTVRRATEGLANYIETLGEQAKQQGIVISYDTRRMSTEFAILAAKVLDAHNIKVFLFENVRPVPVCSFAIRHLNAIAGIMITASHNPKIYNGYKVYGEDGAQMSPEATAKVVEFIDKLDYFGIAEADVKLDKESIVGKDNLKVDANVTIIGKSVDNAYFKEIQKLCLSPDAVKKAGKNIKIVYTPIHGSGYMPVTTILDIMNIPVTVVPEQAKPDTEFSTVKVPNPEESDALKMAIELADKIGSDICIGTDPDCDRMGVAIRNREGKFVLLNGNQIGALLCDYILLRHKQNGTLPANAAIVKTIVTTNLANEIASSYGVKTFDVLTGFKFIGEKIKEWEKTGEYTFMFGYEESYGYLSGTHARDKDAVVASMLFAEMSCFYEAKGSSVFDRLMEIFDTFGYYIEKSVSIFYEGLDGMEKMSAIMDKARSTALEKIDEKKVLSTSDLLNQVTVNADGSKEDTHLPKTNAIKWKLDGGDWVCVRPSGTEPKLKIYVATKAGSSDKANALAEKYVAFMKAFLS